MVTKSNVNETSVLYSLFFVVRAKLSIARGFQERIISLRWIENSSADRAHCVPLPSFRSLARVWRVSIPATGQNKSLAAVSSSREIRRASIRFHRMYNILRRAGRGNARVSVVDCWKKLRRLIVGKSIRASNNRGASIKNRPIFDFKRIYFNFFLFSREQFEKSYYFHIFNVNKISRIERKIGLFPPFFYFFLYYWDFFQGLLKFSLSFLFFFTYIAYLLASSIKNAFYNRNFFFLSFPFKIIQEKLFHRIFNIIKISLIEKIDFSPFLFFLPLLRGMRDFSQGLLKFPPLFFKLPSSFFHTHRTREQLLHACNVLYCSKIFFTIEISFFVFFSIQEKFERNYFVKIR